MNRKFTAGGGIRVMAVLVLMLVMHFSSIAEAGIGLSHKVPCAVEHEIWGGRYTIYITCDDVTKAVIIAADSNSLLPGDERDLIVSFEQFMYCSPEYSLFTMRREKGVQGMHVKLFNAYGKIDDAPYAAGSGFSVQTAMNRARENAPLVNENKCPVVKKS